MNRTLAACLGLALAGHAGAADLDFPEPAGADANIVTAIDGSDSVGGAEMRRQLAALAGAVRSPEVLDAIRRGHSGRIAFTVFVWHERQFEVVPWTPIADGRDAEAVARVIEARMEVNLDKEARHGTRFYIGRLTDLSGALDHARSLLETTPFPAGRAVVNVIGNGADNMGENAAAARDRLLAAGVTVNGVVPETAPGLAAYFRAEVVGGRAAFLLPASARGEMLDLMRLKLLADLMAAVR